MKIIHLVPYGAPYPGGFIPMLGALIRAGAERGHDSEVVLTPAARGRGWLTVLEQTGVPIGFSASESRRDLYAAIVERLPDPDCPTMLHSHFHDFDLPAAMAGSRRKHTGILWHVHSSLETAWRVRAMNTIKYGVVGRLVDRILCVAPNIAAGVRRRLAPSDRVLHVPNAVDVDRLPRPSIDERNAARRSLGLPASPFMLLHFGWLWHLKGGDLFLRTVKLLRDDGHDVLGVTIGGGAEAAALVDELGLGGSARVLAPSDDVHRLYAAADVFVSSSRAEGMPFSMLEALASGTPVVASDLPGPATMATAPGCRLVPLDPSALSNAVASFMERDPDEASRESAAARAWVETNARLEPWAQRLVDLYEQIMSVRSLHADGARR